MKLVDKSMREFSDVLASDAPAPGGGSVAALVGSHGAALIVMVASLTAGRKKYAEHEPLMSDVIERADELRLNFLNLIDRDTEAFNKVSAVFAMPRDTKKQVSERNDAMQIALKACTLTPFEMIGCALSALEIAAKMVGKFNTNAASDLGVAVLSLKAAAQGAWLNVLINLDGIRDEIFAAKYRISGSELVKKATELADGIHSGILHGLLSEV